MQRDHDVQIVADAPKAFVKGPVCIGGERETVARVVVSGVGKRCDVCCLNDRCAGCSGRQRISSYDMAPRLMAFALFSFAVASASVFPNSASGAIFETGEEAGSGPAAPQDPEEVSSTAPPQTLLGLDTAHAELMVPLFAGESIDTMHLPA